MKIIEKVVQIRKNTFTPTLSEGRYNLLASIPPAIGGAKGSNTGYLLSKDGMLQCLAEAHVEKDSNLSLYSNSHTWNILILHPVLHPKHLPKGQTSCHA